MIRKYLWTCVIFAVALFLVLSTSLLPFNTLVQGHLNQGSSINGNQEILGDPFRPVIYWADHEGDELLIWNYSSGDLRQVEAGLNPISIDLDTTGSLLFVAADGDRSLSVIDVRTAEVNHSVELDFTPLSITVSGTERLFISSRNDTLIRTVELPSMAISSAFDPGFHAILDSSPDGSRLLAVAQLWDDEPANISLYNTSGPSPTIMAVSSMGSVILSQTVVDWDNGSFFIAGQGLGGFQMRSLDDLEVTASLGTPSSPNGIALSLDKSKVYGVATGTYWHLPGGRNLERWMSMIFILDAQTFSLEGMKPINGEMGPITTSLDSGAVFVSPPLQRIGVELAISPKSPADGSIYGYAPSYVGFTFNDSIIPAIPADEVALFIDGTPYEVEQVEDGGYRAAMQDPLSSGHHDVEVCLGGIQDVWTFRIEPNSTLAIFPQARLISPENGSIYLELPSQIAVAYEPGEPGPIGLSIRLEVNGIDLETYTDDSHPNTVFAQMPSFFDFGELLINATMEWVNGSRTWSWTCVSQMIPSISCGFPNPGSYLPISPSHIEAVYYEGRPAVSVEEMEVTIDGVPYEYDSWRTDESSLLFRVNLTSELPEGLHVAHFNATTSLGVYEALLEFTIGSFVRCDHDDDVVFSMLVPDSWPIENDIVIAEQEVKLLVRGPINDGIQTNLQVISGYDRSAREDHQYLDEQAAATVEELTEAGINVTLMGDPTFSTISNHTAATFTLRWTDTTIIQDITVIVNEGDHRYLIITCTTDLFSYPEIKPVFDRMISSFTWEDTEASPWDLQGPILFGAAIGIGTAIAIVVTLAIIRKRRS